MTAALAEPQGVILRGARSGTVHAATRAESGWRLGCDRIQRVLPDARVDITGLPPDCRSCKARARPA